MAAKLTRLTHKIAIQLHLVTESCTICSLAPGGQSAKFWTHPRTLYHVEWPYLLITDFKLTGNSSSFNGFTLKERLSINVIVFANSHSSVLVCDGTGPAKGWPRILGTLPHVENINSEAKRAGNGIKIMMIITKNRRYITMGKRKRIKWRLQWGFEKLRHVMVGVSWHAIQ